MTPLVSILIPAYNSERWIGEALASAVNQTWPRTEVIVVDDGSTDATGEIARSFSPNAVTVATQRNFGAAVARNHAFSLSRGEYIQWLDADDVLAPDKIERQLRQATPPGTLFSSAWSRFHYRIEKARPFESCLWQDLSPADWLILKLRENAWMAIETWLISRLLAEKAGSWNTELTADDDGEYMSRVVCASETVKFVPEAHVYVRDANATSLTRGFFSDQKWDSQFRAMTLQIQQLREREESGRVRHACLQYLQRWQINFYPEHISILEAANGLAQELGGELHTPKLRWKYRPIVALLGWQRAKWLTWVLPRLKESAIRNWDRLLFWISQIGNREAGRGSFPNQLLFRLGRSLGSTRR